MKDTTNSTLDTVSQLLTAIGALLIWALVLGVLGFLAWVFLF